MFVATRSGADGTKRPPRPTWEGNRRKPFPSPIQPFFGSPSLLFCARTAAACVTKISRVTPREERRRIVASTVLARSLLPAYVTVTIHSVVCCAVSSTLHHLDDPSRKLRNRADGSRDSETIPEYGAHSPLIVRGEITLCKSKRGIFN